MCIDYRIQLHPTEGARPTREPTRTRPFRAPAVWFVAPMGVIFNLGMMLTLEWQNWVRLVIWLAIGLAIYFMYGRKHSVMANLLAKARA